MTSNLIEFKVSDKTMNKGILMISFIIFLILFLIIFLFFKDDFVNFIRNNKALSIQAKMSKLLLLIISSLLAVIFHELIHGFFFSKYNLSGWKKVKFGFNTKLLAPYATCQEPVKVKHFIIILLMPTIILGIIPLLIFLFIKHNFFIFLFAAIMILGGIGDFLITYYMIKLKPNQYVIDHPTTLGYFIVENFQKNETDLIIDRINSIKQENLKLSKKKKNNNILYLFFVFFLGVISMLLLKHFF